MGRFLSVALALSIGAVAIASHGLMFGPLVLNAGVTFAKSGQHEDRAPVGRARWAALAEGLQSDATMMSSAKADERRN
jgi:hypothetical protein